MPTPIPKDCGNDRCQDCLQSRLINRLADTNRIMYTALIEIMKKAEAKSEIEIIASVALSQIQAPKGTHGKK